MDTFIIITFFDILANMLVCFLAEYYMWRSILLSGLSANCEATGNNPSPMVNIKSENRGKN